MTKDEWIKVKNEPYIPLGVWYAYYKEMNGIIEDVIEFEKVFNNFMSEHTILYNPIWNTFVEVSSETARKRLFKYYDSIFNL